MLACTIIFVRHIQRVRRVGRIIMGDFVFLVIGKHQNPFIVSEVVVFLVFVNTMIGRDVKIPSFDLIKAMQRHKSQYKTE